MDVLNALHIVLQIVAIAVLHACYRRRARPAWLAVMILAMVLILVRRVWHAALVKLGMPEIADAVLAAVPVGVSVLLILSGVLLLHAPMCTSRPAGGGPGATRPRTG